MGRRIGHEIGRETALDGSGRVADGDTGELEAGATGQAQVSLAVEQGSHDLPPHGPGAEDGDAERGAAHTGDGPSRDIARMVADRSRRPPGERRRLHSRR